MHVFLQESLYKPCLYPPDVTFAAVLLFRKQQQDFLCNILPQDPGKYNPEIQKAMPDMAA